MGIRDFIRNRVNRMAESMDLFKKDEIGRAHV